MKTKPRRNPPRNALLEKLTSNGRLTNKQISYAAQCLAWPERKVERWLRKKALASIPSKLEKFLYSSYLTTFHFGSVILGIFVLYDKPWVADISLTLKGLPFHEISSLNWWYYMMSSGFYCSVAVFSHHNEKADLIHHVSTITLLVFSWACNLVRAGTLVLFIHEFGDLTLQICKMLDYLGWQKQRNVALGVFTAVFGISRAVVFPWWIIGNMIVMAPKHMTPPPCAYIFYSFLIMLFVVNLYWCYLVLLVLSRTIFKGAELADVRSESSVSSTDDDNNCNHKNSVPKED